LGSGLKDSLDHIPVEIMEQAALRCCRMCQKRVQSWGSCTTHFQLSRAHSAGIPVIRYQAVRTLKPQVYEIRVASFFGWPTIALTDPSEKKLLASKVVFSPSWIAPCGSSDTHQPSTPNTDAPLSPLLDVCTGIIDSKKPLLWLVTGTGRVDGARGDHDLQTGSTAPVLKMQNARCGAPGVRVKQM